MHLFDCWIGLIDVVDAKTRICGVEVHSRECVVDTNCGGCCKLRFCKVVETCKAHNYGLQASLLDYKMLRST